MINDLVNERIKEIIDWAKDNGNVINYRTAVDILKANQSPIADERIDEIIYWLENEKGIVIDSSNDEEYSAASSEDAFIPADVNIFMKNVSLDTIASRLENDEIDLTPDYQRYYDLWTVTQKSRLIESLMLQIPIPAFYFDGSKEEKWVVIDGLQRLSAIKGFIVEDDYRLTNLEYLTEFNDFSFSQLPRQYVRRIRETQLVLYIVARGTPSKIVFNIFKRLNTGGLVLTSQEIRHALNQGRVINLLRRMATCDEFRIATGYSIKSKRMADCEYANRFLAFYTMNFEDYDGNIDDFLNNALVKANNTAQDELELVFVAYKRALSSCFKLFGRYAFRRVKYNETRGPVNKALFECFTVGVLLIPDEYLEKIEEGNPLIMENYIAFVNSDFGNYLKAGDRYTVMKRFQMTEDFLEKLCLRK